MEEPQPKTAWQEQPGTYFVQDRANPDELTRLQTQDTMMTEGMGGVLPEQDQPSRFQRVLDVGCGTAGWLQKWGNKQVDYKALFQDLLDDIQRPDFKATWRLVTFWGQPGSQTPAKQL